MSSMKWVGTLKLINLRKFCLLKPAWLVKTTLFVGNLYKINLCKGAVQGDWLFYENDITF